MTQEEIQQKAYEVYPLDLDRHLIIEGEPYDNNKEKREAYIRGLTDSKPELPSNLDEAANDGWAVYEYRESPRGLYSTCYVDGFKAGAEWMMKQLLASNPRETDLYKLGKSEALEELKKNLADNDIYRVPEWLREVLVMAKENGKKEALKDLPRWEKDNSIKAEQHITVGKNGERFHYKGHSLLIPSLVKLPGFKEN